VTVRTAWRPADPGTAVALAHLVVEADLGPVCGPIGRAALDQNRLDQKSTRAVGRSPARATMTADTNAARSAS
jgi:hypothetical protein